MDQYDLIRHNTIQHSTVQHYATLNNAIKYSYETTHTVQYDTIKWQCKILNKMYKISYSIKRINLLE